MVAPAESPKTGSTALPFEKIVDGDTTKFNGTVNCPYCDKTNILNFMRPNNNIPPVLERGYNCNSCGEAFKATLDTGIRIAAVSKLNLL